MNEATFYGQHVAPQLKQWGDHCRVENTAESGTPDISYGIHGRHGWIETKIIRGGYLSFETFQLAWLRKRARAVYGKDLWVLATDGSSLFLYTAPVILNAKRKKRKDWMVIHVDDLSPICFSEAMPWGWGQILAILTYSNGIQDSIHDPRIV